jgi:SAM-dependent methyltransferase
MEPELYRAHARLEDTHWWFRGRRAVVREVMRRHLGPRPSRRVLDVGCGTGGMLPLLSELGSVEGLESSEQALALAREKLGDRAVLRRGELPSGIPAGQKYELITAFDVIEHIPDAVGALSAMREALVPGGELVCTVPAFQFLWSAHDELNHHVRRYDATLLGQHLEAAGLRLRYRSYFNSVLFPPAAAVRLARKLLPEKNPSADLEEAPPLVNRALEALFSLERHVVPRQPLPFGVSLIAVAFRD